MKPLLATLRPRARAALTLLLAASLAPQVAMALDYETEEGWSFELPHDGMSFGTSVGTFPESTVGSVSGYELVGRMLAATGRTVYMQASSGVVTWLPVARLAQDEAPMDPSFLVVSRDGRKVALGVGYGKPLYVFPSALLSADVPLELSRHKAVKRWDVSYYDGVFRDDRFLFLNRGADHGQSEIVVVDTEQTGPSAISLAISDIPGASAGLAFDAHGNLVTGIGWDSDFTQTGQLKIFDALALDTAIAQQTPQAYEGAGSVVAENVLSAAFLTFDQAGNLLVGGGDVFGTTGNYGYAAVIDTSVLDRVRAGGPPMDPGSPDEFSVLAPDPCMNDDATQVVYVPGTQAVMVSYNPASQPPDCADFDWSGSDGSKLQVYVPADAPDEDGDGIPDAIDADFGKPDPIIGRADYARLINAFGSTVDDVFYDASADYDRSGSIDEADFQLFLTRWGTLRAL